MIKRTFIHRLFFLSFGVALALQQSGFSDEKGIESASPLFINKRNVADFQVRVLCWNIWKGSILPPAGKRHENFKRIVSALNPDVICLQEAVGKKVEQLPLVMDRMIPLGGTKKWQMHRDTASDNVIISRYPLDRHSYHRITPAHSVAPGFYLGFIGCSIKLPDEAKIPELYLVATHFASGGGLAMRERQKHADAIVSHLRELKNEGDLAFPMPTVILGDLNVYSQEPKDATHHLMTLITGNIVDNSTYGEDMHMDWDGSFLAEVKPRHNGFGKDWYTWRSDESIYPPGALDRIIYTDSVIKVEHSFILNTTIMSPEGLHKSGLLKEDVLINQSTPGEFDHLPLIVDFSLLHDAITKLRPPSIKK